MCPNRSSFMKIRTRCWLTRSSKVYLSSWKLENKCFSSHQHISTSLKAIIRKQKFIKLLISYYYFRRHICTVFANTSRCRMLFNQLDIFGRWRLTNNQYLNTSKWENNILKYTRNKCAGYFANYIFFAKEIFIRSLLICNNYIDK